jgi:hypothetical protein
MGPGLPSTRERKVSPGDIRAHETGSSKQKDGGKTTGPEAGVSKNYFTANSGSPEAELHCKEIPYTYSFSGKSAASVPISTFMYL